jgi:hypothetical protein
MTFHGDARLASRDAEGNFSLKTTALASGASHPRNRRVGVLPDAPDTLRREMILS